MFTSSDKVVSIRKIHVLAQIVNSEMPVLMISSYSFSTFSFVMLWAPTVCFVFHKNLVFES
jgi:hypothetical protein